MGSGFAESELLEQRFDADAASLGVAYLLALTLGPLGAHRLYLGFRGTAFCMLVGTVLGVATFSARVGMLVLVGVAVWWVVDLVRMRQLYQLYVRRFRQRLTIDLSVR